MGTVLPACLPACLPASHVSWQQLLPCFSWMGFCPSWIGHRRFSPQEKLCCLLLSHLRAVPPVPPLLVVNTLRC
jgi:hypothetical protein